MAPRPIAATIPLLLAFTYDPLDDIVLLLPIINETTITNTPPVRYDVRTVLSAKRCHWFAWV
jgi:hypothetical protein